MITDILLLIIMKGYCNYLTNKISALVMSIPDFNNPPIIKKYKLKLLCWKLSKISKLYTKSL